MAHYHSLLQRQLKRFGVSVEDGSAEWKKFIDVVNEAYIALDDDRAMFERSLELSSQELLQTNAQMRGMFQAFPDLYFHMDSTGKILQFASGSIDALADSPANMVGQRVHDILPQTARETISTAIQDVMRTNSLVAVEYALVVEGEEEIFEARFVPFSGQQVSAIIRNITERKRAEAALQEKRTQLEGIFNSTMDAIITVNEDQKIVIFNPAAEQMFRCPASEVIGETLDRFLPEFVRAEHRAYMRAFGQSHTTKRSMRTPALALTCLRADGEAFPTEVSVSKLELGGQKLYTAIVRDVTERKLTEEELRRTNEALQALIKSSPVSIVALDPGGNVTEWNPASERIFGWSREEVLGRFLPYVSKDRLEEHGTLRDRVLQGESSTGIEVLRARKDGSPVYLSISTAPLHGADGRVVGIIGVNVDITDRRSAENNLLTLRAAINASGEAFFLTDVNGVFTFVNPGFCSLYGYTADEVIGKSTPRILRSRQLKSEDYEMFWKTITSKKEVRSQYKNKRKDGTLVDIDATASPILDEKQNLIGFLGIQKDITEHQADVERVQNSEEHLRTILENLRDAVFTLSPHGIFLSANPAFQTLTGWPVEEWIGKSFTGIIHREDYPVVRRMFARVLGGETTPVVEIRIRKKDGSFVVGEILASPYRRNDRIVGVLGIGRDVTSRKQTESEKKSLESQLQQVQKLESLGTLASGIAHDFNNILAIIMAHSSILEKIAANPQKLGQSVEAIVKAGKRGASLVQQLLTYARKSDSVLESLSVNDVVRDIAKFLVETIPKTITVESRLDFGIQNIVADATQIHQVLLNLCVNARDAMPSGGRIGITTSMVAGNALKFRFPDADAHAYVEVVVTDSGTGMNNETLRRIFEPFFTTKEVGKGTGLGLALVFSIVRNHEGFVDVESKMGTGTTFYLYFPVEVADPREIAYAEAPRSAPAGGTETILIIEDEELLRDFMKMEFVANGYTVMTAADGEEGVEVFSREHERIALVLSDLGLPKLGGLEVFQRIHAIDPNVRFVVASGFIDPAAKSQMFRSGVKQFVQKPYDPMNVMRVVREILDLKK